MNPANEKISILYASMLIISGVGVFDHVTIIPMLLKTSGRDSWIAVAITGIFFFLWIPVLLFIMRRTGMEHLRIGLKRRLGAFPAGLIMALIVIQLFMISTHTLEDVSNWTRITYLPATPKLIILLALSAVCYYAACSGIRAIAIVNGILLPFVVLFGFFVAAANIPHKDYSLLFPLFADGIAPVVHGMVYSGAGLFELIMILFLQHHIKGDMRPLPLFITGLILLELILSPLTGGIAEFGAAEGGRMRFTAFEEWRLITFGHFIENVDFLSIYQWLVGALVRISLPLFLIPDLLGITRGKQRAWLMAGIAFMSVAAAEILFSDTAFYRFTYKFYLPYSLVLWLVLSLIIAAAAAMNTERMRSVP